jgi:hypothetical protein
MPVSSAVYFCCLVSGGNSGALGLQFIRRQMKGNDLIKPSSGRNFWIVAVDVPRLATASRVRGLIGALFLEQSAISGVLANEFGGAASDCRRSPYISQ